MLHAALAELDEVRFSFARPHGEWALAGVELGLRRFYWCDRRLRRIEHKPSYANPTFTRRSMFEHCGRGCCSRSSERLRRFA